MPATAAVPTNKYSNLEDIYENYTSVSKFIFFEDDVYEFRESKRANDTEIHLYRCDAEQHNLKIHLKSGVPYLVEGSYSIEAVKL